MKVDINQQNLQAQMERLSNIAKNGTGNVASGVEQVPSNNQFGSLLGSAINKVNQYQMQSAQAATQIETGDGGASLVKAVIAFTKSQCCF